MATSGIPDVKAGTFIVFCAPDSETSIGPVAETLASRWFDPKENFIRVRRSISEPDAGHELNDAELISNVKDSFGRQFRGFSAERIPILVITVLIALLPGLRVNATVA